MNDKTKDQVINKLNAVLNTFYNHPIDDLLNPEYDNLLTQKECLSDGEPVSQEHLNQTFQNAVHVRTAMLSLRKINYVFG